MEYMESKIQDQLEASIADGEEYYCPKHRYNPAPNSGFCFCPKCEFPEAFTEEELK